MEMKMLAKFWRLWFRNDTTDTMTFDQGARIAIRSMPWKISSAGNLTYGTVITEDFGFIIGETIVDGGVVSGTVVDNSSNLHQGFNGTFEIIHDTVIATDNCSLFIEISDNNGNWPSDTDDHDIDDLQRISLLPIENSDVDKSRSVNFSFPL